MSLYIGTATVGFTPTDYHSSPCNLCPTITAVKPYGQTITQMILAGSTQTILDSL